MKKLLHKSCQWLLMLVAMFAVSFTASADKVVSFDFNAGDGSGSTKDGVTVSMPALSDISDWGGGIGGSSCDITVTAQSEIKSVVFTNASYSYGSYYTNNWSVTDGTVSGHGTTTATVTPAAGSTKVVIHVNASSFNILTMDVTVGEGGGTVTPDPVVKPNFPAESTAYQIQLASSSNYTSLGYLNVAANTNSCTFGAAPEALYFTWVESEGAFTIKDADGNYIGGASNTWTVGYNVPEYWTVTEARDGVYTFKSKTSSYLGFNTSSGTAYRNCTENDDVYFKLEAYQAPAVDPDPVDPGTGGGSDGSVTFDMTSKAAGTHTQGVVQLVASNDWFNQFNISGAACTSAGNTLKFSATDGSNITKIVIENGLPAYAFNNSTFSANPAGTVNVTDSYYTWEGSASEVILTTGGYNAIVAKTITVEYAAVQGTGGGTTGPDPGTDPGTDPEDTKPSFPAEGVTYQLQLVDDYATSYLNLQKDKTQAAILGAAPQGFTFTWDDENKGFIVKNTDGLYLGKPDAIVNSGIGCQNPDYWNVVQNGNSYYLKCSKGYLGFSSYSTGATATCNNAAAEDAFIFTEYVAPDLTPFASIPASFIRESSIDMQVGDQIVSQLAFIFTASSDYGVDAFKLYPNGKSINLIVDGKSTSATLTCTQSGYCSISGMYPAISDEGDHNIVFPEGTFEAANGKVNAAFEYVYTILPAEAVQYTVGIYGPWSQSGAQPAPAGAYIVYKNAPETHYASGDSYASENVPRVDDFACGIPYWEIDEQHSIISEYGKSITIYLKRIPYTYDIVIEGCEQGAVTYYGTQYSATDDITTLEFIDEDEIEAVAVKGYNIVTTTINQPAEGKGGVIYVKYEEKPVVYATVDRTDPATGVYDLNDHLNGLSSLNVYLAKGDEFSQFGYYTSDGNMPEGINVTDAQGNVTNYAVGGIMSWNGYSFCIVSLANAIREAGIYTINIPAGALPLADEEKVSPEMHLTYEVKAATVFEIDNRDGVTAQGNRKDNGGLKTLTGFEITAPEGVTFDAIASDAKLYVQGEMDPETWTYGDPVEIEGVTFSFGTTKQTVLVNFSEPYAPEASESYTFILPEGTITATDGRTNKEISLSAYVDPVEYFDLVVTYPVEGNAVAPVDHITVQLPEGLTVTNVDGYILFNGYQAEGYTYTQNDRELTINFGSEHAGEAGSTVSYYFGGSNITATDANSTVWKNNWKDANNIPVTAAPVEYLVEFAGLEGVALPASPAVTYNNEQYSGQKHIVAVDLTVEQLQATDVSGYEYTITIDKPGYEASHGLGRVLVTYTKALNLAAVDLNMYDAADSKEGVSSAVAYPTTSGANIWNADEPQYGVIKVNSPRPIRKVEIYVSSNASSVFERGQQGDFTVAGNIATWTGNSNALVFAATDEIYVTKLVAYYDADAEIPVDNSVALAKAVGGDVNYINRYVSLDFDANFAGTHSAYSGQTDIPEGVKFCRVNSDGSEDEVTISEFNYWAGGAALSVVLENSIYTPGAYRLTIPAGTLEFAGGKGNSAIEVNWTISHFGLDEVAVIGNEADGSATFTEINGLEVTPAEGIVITGLTAGAAPVVNYTCGEDEGTLAIESFEALNDGSAQIFFDESITADGRYTFSIPEGLLIMEGGYTNAAYGRGISATIDTKTHFVIDNVYSTRHYDFVNNFSTYYITAEDPDISDMLEEVENPFEYITAPFEVSYYDEDNVRHVENVTVTGAIIDKHNWLLSFAPVTVPFNTEYTLTFPAGFITKDNYVSSPSYIEGNQIWKHYPYSVHYEGFTAEEGVKYLCYLPTTTWCEDGADLNATDTYGEVTTEQLSAKSIDNMMPVFTIEHPYVNADGQVVKGSITLSYETIEPVPFDGHFTLNGTPSNLGKDFLCSLESITIPAPEGHTFLSADDCVLLIQGNTDTEYTHYESVTATISEDGSEVTITLTPAYSTPAFATGFKLAEGSLILDNGADYIGFNCSISIFPEYAFNIDHTDPADRAAIYNGDLDHIDVYLPAGLNVGYNTDFAIEVVGTDYVESFQPSYISNFGDFYRIQLSSGMSLPAGRITVTIPSDVFYYYDYENNDRYVTNAPYTLWIDNYSALQLVTEPAAGTVVGLDAIRVKGERGTLWSPNTDVETLAQSVHFGTYEGAVAVNTTIENGVLVVTPVETLAEGNYTLTIDGLAGILESADVAASVNAPARFEFNVVGSTFAFQGARPNDGKTISELTELETINLSFSWNVGNVRVSEQAGNDPIAVTLTDGDGTEQTVILTYPAVSESEWGGSVAQLVGNVQGVDFASTADGKYNVSLTIPAGIFVSDNGRTNEAMTLHYVYDSNKYFAVSPNFESWGHVTGPVKTFTLTAAEGVTFTGIAPDKVDDPENGVDRPTVFKNSSYLTYAIPTISADGKSVTLTLAEPISADSPYDQYYLVVPDGLFSGTLGTAEGVTFPATSTGFGAWQQAFYVDAPAYDHVEISGPVENGESITSYGGYIYVYVNKTIGGDQGIPAGTTFTSADGQSVEINNMWSVWSSDYSYFVVNTASNLQPGTYTLHVPADSRYADGVIDFTFTLVETFDLADGTFAPTGTVVAQTLESFTWTAPEGKTIQSVDVTKIGNWGYDDNSNWTIIPLAGLSYAIAGEKNQVVFTFAEPISPAEGEFNASIDLIFQSDAITCADGSMSKGGSYSVTIDPFPNDINRDGKEDNVDDAIAISDIILHMDRWYENNTSKADLNGDGEVTIGDLVKYIQQLQPSVNVKDEPTEELGD